MTVVTRAQAWSCDRGLSLADEQSACLTEKARLALDLEQVGRKR